MDNENADNSQKPERADDSAQQQPNKPAEIRDTVYMPKPIIADRATAASDKQVEGPADEAAKDTATTEAVAAHTVPTQTSPAQTATTESSPAAEPSAGVEQPKTTAVIPVSEVNSTTTTAAEQGPLLSQMPQGIEVNHVARNFGRTHVLKDISFSADPGKITALIGPNGSGKTTLMLILASLLKASKGSVKVAGLDPTVDGARLHSKIGWMPDTIGIWSTLSPRQSLRAIAKLYGIDSANAKLRTEELLREMDLSDLARKPSQTLSRGQRQRLSFARAIIHNPEILILDEPMSGLDPQARITMRIQLRRLADEGKTVLISSHVLAELEEFADEAVYIDHGETIDAATAAAVTETRRVWVIEPLHPELAATQMEQLKLPFTRQGDRFKIDAADNAAAASLLATMVSGGVQIVEFHPEIGKLEATLTGIQTSKANQAATDAAKGA